MLNRVARAFHMLSQGKPSCFPLVREALKDKSGIEIGGPSRVFDRWYQPLPIYKTIKSLDNCVFSASTVWASQSGTYVFHDGRKPGKVIICDGADMGSVADNSYEFVLSSHNLEHFANPIKALKEWERVVCPGGELVMILPYYSRTFDHRRTPTKVAHLIDDFNQNVQENDLTHLPEILQLHDLSMDTRAGSFDQFRERSLNNVANRCLHHHVFDENNSRELLEYLGMKVLAVETAYPYHLLLFAEFREQDLG